MKQLTYEPSDYGWRAELPREMGTVFGRSITVDISTRHIPTEPKELPAVHQEQNDLLSFILDSLPRITQLAELGLRDWHQRAGAKFDEIQEKLSNPRIWIMLEDASDLKNPAPRKDREWTLVVGVDGAPDFGFHIEFEKDNLVDVWAGD